ncbi:MAG: hypothetical protein HC874_26135 [Richelia sp. SL_2_1]|nr:hypothetical protein [Richelia sp. SL_2_1]
MSTVSTLTKAQIVEKMGEMLLKSIKGGASLVKDPAELVANRAAEIEQVKDQIAALKARLVKVTSTGEDVMPVVLELAALKVPAELTEAEAKEQADSMLANLVKELALASVNHLQINDMVVPARSGERRAPMDNKIEGGRLVVNGETVPGFVARGGLVVIPHGSALPAGTEGHGTSRSTFGKIVDGKFQVLKQFTAAYNTLSGLMKEYQEDWQGLNGTPFTANENARAGKKLTSEEIALMF